MPKEIKNGHWQRTKQWFCFFLGSAAGIASQHVPEFKATSDAWVKAATSTSFFQQMKSDKTLDSTSFQETESFVFSSIQAPSSIEGEPVASFLVHNPHFSLAYDARTKNPIWVYEKLSFAPQGEENKLLISEEATIPAYLRVDEKGYEQKGVVATNLLEKSQAAPTALTPLCPLCAQLTQGYWNKIKEYTQRLSNAHRSVQVITGPLYLSYTEGRRRFVKYEVIGSDEVAVPSHFFKVFFIETANGGTKSEAFVFPNRMIPLETPIETFRTSVQKIERAAGLLFPRDSKANPKG